MGLMTGRKVAKILTASLVTGAYTGAAYKLRQQQDVERKPLTEQDVRNVAIVSALMVGSIWFCALG